MGMVWKIIPSQKVYVCFTQSLSRDSRVIHVYYNREKALEWKTKIENILEQREKLNHNNGGIYTIIGLHGEEREKVDELNDRLLEEFGLEYDEHPHMQEKALE